MFKNLSEKFSQITHKLSGRSRITEDNIQDVSKDIRSALLEADVGLLVIESFIDDVKRRAIGKEVSESLKPGQVFIKIIYEELEKLLGKENEGLRLNAKAPVVILLVGLQGSGKTTTAAKLARFIKEEQKKSVLLASADIYRPAAIQQLQMLAQEIQVDFLDVKVDENPLDIVRRAISLAENQSQDVLILDTAGRLHIDSVMMDEIKAIYESSHPAETLLVVDSMTGQDAVKTAAAFNEVLPLTGVILTKTDGDARGGAAVSIRFVTGKPIKFVGVGEKVTSLEPFYADRMASRILGMGDILSLVEEAEKKIDKKQAEKFAKKFMGRGKFDLEDFLEQIQQMKKLGGISKIMEKIPGVGGLSEAIKSKVTDDAFVKPEAIIRSMTPQERRFPALIKGSRKQRIARGSGTEPRDINHLLKQFEKMQKMMEKGMGKLLQGVRG
jgi:signal recognition particle subunit SRP54